MAVTQKSAAMREEDLAALMEAAPQPKKLNLYYLFGGMLGGLALSAMILLATQQDDPPPAPTPAPAIQPPTPSPTLSGEPASAGAEANTESDADTASPGTPAPVDPTPSEHTTPTTPSATGATFPTETPERKSKPRKSTPKPSTAQETAEHRDERRRESAKLVRQARAASVSDPARAYELANRSLDKYPTVDGYRLLGLSACKLGKVEAAKRAYRKLTGETRESLVTLCRRKGINVE
jgi:hypothetical protein